MALVRRNPDLFPSASNLFDEFFNTELSDWRRKNYSDSNTTLPKVNIKEDDDGFVVEMAAPGMTKGDFNIELNQNLLTISSERKEEDEKDLEKYSRREFAYKSFCRSFTLPDSANGEKISAKYENGILVLTIPKKEEAKPKPPRSIKIS